MNVFGDQRCIASLLQVGDALTSNSALLDTALHLPGDHWFPGVIGWRELDGSEVEFRVARQEGCDARQVSGRGSFLETSRDEDPLGVRFARLWLFSSLDLVERGTRFDAVAAALLPSEDRGLKFT